MIQQHTKHKTTRKNIKYGDCELVIKEHTAIYNENIILASENPFTVLAENVEDENINNDDFLINVYKEIDAVLDGETETE